MLLCSEDHSVTGQRTVPGIQMVLLLVHEAHCEFGGVENSGGVPREAVLIQGPRGEDVWSLWRVFQATLMLPSKVLSVPGGCVDLTVCVSEGAHAAGPRTVMGVLGFSTVSVLHVLEGISALLFSRSCRKWSPYPCCDRVSVQQRLSSCHPSLVHCKMWLRKTTAIYPFGRT